MYYIDPHIHMISRITDDYQRMAQCGCVAVSEPAFWAGFDRGSAEGFRDYFRPRIGKGHDSVSSTEYQSPGQLFSGSPQ